MKNAAPCRGTEGSNPASSRGESAANPISAGQGHRLDATDYDTNYAFVRHVLSMDTTFPENALLYRHITSPALWQVGYALIIVGRGMCSTSGM